MIQVKIEVYGSNVPCPSCLHSPSSKDTFEWLEAALTRKYPNQTFIMEYIDIDSQTQSEDNSFLNRILAEEIFYPAVVLNGQLIAEGEPQLKAIFAVMEEHGYIPEY